jgi:hypothetical protein
MSKAKRLIEELRKNSIKHFRSHTGCHIIQDYIDKGDDIIIVCEDKTFKVDADPRSLQLFVLGPCPNYIAAFDTKVEIREC